MPYIITTKQSSSVDGLELHELPEYPTMIVESRLAVATLGEARERVSDIIDVHGSGGRAWAWHEAGGTFGPLPDGTVIEVETMTWPQLANLAGWRGRAFRLMPGDAAQIIDTYNARVSWQDSPWGGVEAGYDKP